MDYIRRDVARGQAEEKHSEELDETFEDPFCNDDADQIHSALDQLEPRQREVLILHFLEEFSVAQIAHIVNCPEGTVKSRIHYAKKAMKTILRGTYEKLLIPSGSGCLPAFPIRQTRKLIESPWPMHSNAASKRTVRRESILAKLFWIFCVVTAVAYLWFTAESSQLPRAPFIACIFFSLGRDGDHQAQHQFVPDLTC